MLWLSVAVFTLSFIILKDSLPIVFNFVYYMSESTEGKLIEPDLGGAEYGFL